MTQVLEAASAQKCRPPIDLSCSIGVLLRSNIVSDLSRKSWLSRLSPAHTATADELDQNFRTCTRIHCRTDHGPIIWTVAEQPGIDRQAGCTKQYVLLLVLANSGSCCLCQCLRRCPCTALFQHSLPGACRGSMVASFRPRLDRPRPTLDMWPPLRSDVSLCQTKNVAKNVLTLSDPPRGGRLRFWTKNVNILRSKAVLRTRY